jgi:hypothetical protein
MKMYLRIINPMVAIVVLLLCLYAATFDDGFKPDSILKGSIAMYFVAKGIFCSSALYLLGRILLVLMAKTEGREVKPASM